MQLTQRNLVANVVQSDAAINITEDDVMIGVLPFFHVYGLTVLVNLALRKGATVVTMPRFDLEGFLTLLQEHRVTFACLVPPIVLALAKHPSVDGYDLSALERVHHRRRAARRGDRRGRRGAPGRLGPAGLRPDRDLAGHLRADA